MQKATKLQKRAKQLSNLFEDCNWVKLALKLSYDGQNYMGFEKSEAGAGKSIEDFLFTAMKDVKIINSEEPE